MSKLLILTKWAKFASEFSGDVLFDFIENSSRNSRQHIADKISFRQKLIRIIGPVNKFHYFEIDQLRREDRYYRFYDC